ncbi:DUF421 domain-containing protein [Parapusillimonas granuli]|uniref:DUF421 domain-containing protein n=1 Tax=Parapusillimonas granuli TaxID=380911 RepID=A0A853G6A5_9BURK|nr:DUF421 domain-containing protein [Parapusillimonas granuli]MBB5214208.1 uncharacterized membrane protein YcaP (DUF421 family) [Parapusillimonas granuli]MEB2399035.1 DUF421 domain-containing protein [Alcaligenaceae bacterium]NYT51312.1 DUF421 domain-containing protein [Parapusillimonas granuli]
MNAFDWQRMLLDKFPWTFLGEVAFRAAVAYVLVFAFLKISGRRGIKQLSLFEVVVILTLGSAAGDVTLYGDVPLLPVFMIFSVLLVMYRLTTFFMSRSVRFSYWMEGEPVTFIREGLYEIENMRRLNVSEDEFLMELRQQSVEHLGQVRLAVIEVDGNISLYFYEDDDLRPGLSVLPPEHRPAYETTPCAGLHACINCGNVEEIPERGQLKCPRCGEGMWSRALSTRRAR